MTARIPCICVECNAHHCKPSATCPYACWIGHSPCVKCGADATTDDDGDSFCDACYAALDQVDDCWAVCQ